MFPVTSLKAVSFGSRLTCSFFFSSFQTPRLSLFLYIRSAIYRLRAVSYFFFLITSHLLYWICHGNSTRWQGMKQDFRPNWYLPLHYPPSPWKVVPHYLGLCPIFFTNSSVGSFTSHKNQNRERAVRRKLRFFVLIREDYRISNHLLMSQERQDIFLTVYY